MGIAIFMERLKSKDDAERYAAFQEMLEITEEKVSWFDEYKDELGKRLKDENSYQRSIAAMLLCNLAKSAAGGQSFEGLLKDLMALVDDEKFITQRQYLQNIWKVAIVDEKLEKPIVKQLVAEFGNCGLKNHHNLLRLDIISSLAMIAKHKGDAKLMKTARTLAESEADAKSKKKYLAALGS